MRYDRVTLTATGATGYQEIDDSGAMVRLTDADGNTLSADTDVNPYTAVQYDAPTPSWGTP